MWERPHQLVPQVVKLGVSLHYLHGAAIQGLNGAVPDNIGTNARRGATDDDVIVDGHMLGPQGLALLGALVGVVLEGDLGRPRIVD